MNFKVGIFLTALTVGLMFSVSHPFATVVGSSTATVGEKYQLKTNPADIIHSTAFVDVVDGKKINKIKYAYLDKSVPSIGKFPDEDITKRTSNSYTVNKGENNEGKEVLETTFFSKPQFAKDITGSWRQVEYAVTTQDVFLASGANFHVRKRELAERLFGIKPVFATVSTFYPDAHTETSTADGKVQSYSDVSWTAAHDATSGTATDTAITTRVYVFHFYFVDVETEEIFDEHTIERAFFSFDTSAIGATDSIDSVTFSLYVTATSDDDNDGSDFISIVQGQGDNYVSDTAVSAGDFDQAGDAIDNPTEGHTTAQRKDITSISTGAYLDWTFNSTGEGWVARSGEQKPTGGTAGITYLAAREGHDITDVPLGNNDTNSITFYTADQTGTSQDPKLVVTHTADTTAPAAVSDLAASAATATSVDLDWTAPGDDNTTGTATTYDVRYSTATITEGNWSSATQATGEPTPSVAGSSESMTVSGLSPATTYYFAMKTSDEIPNTSTISNIASLLTAPGKHIRLAGVRLGGVRLY